MNTLPERISALIRALNQTTLTFSREIGDHRSEKIRRVLEGKGAPSFKMIESIKRRFPSVNLNWLVVGSGPMLEHSSKVEKSSVYLKSTRGGSIVPLVSESESSKYVAKKDDPLYLSSLPVAEDDLYLEGVFRDFVMASSSMSPVVMPGDIVRGVHSSLDGFNDEDPTLVAVVTESSIIIRRMVVNKNKVALLSIHPESFQPIYLKPDKISELWRVVEIRKRSF